MSESCSHDCASCAENCAERQNPQDFRKAPHPLSDIGRVIAVVSGKGGVGKSLVTALLACAMQRRESRVAILDADITGPSIPRLFGIHGRASGGEDGIRPAVTATGIEIMSTNLLLESETAPVIWRGPIIAGMVTQFWTEVVWQGIDYMFVDMPPGTGDVPLTVFQSLPVDGVVVVTSPQNLVGMIVEKAVNMAEMMDIPVLGIVENMSYFECPDCKKRHSIFGESKIEEIAARHGIKDIARLPIDPAFAKASDEGKVERLRGDWLDGIADKIAALDSEK